MTDPLKMTPVATGRTDRMEYDEWRTDRGKGIGGSDAAVLMGCSPYRDAFCTYVDKTVEELPDQSTRPARLNESAYWGLTLEPLLAAEFVKRAPLPAPAGLGERLGLIKPAFYYSTEERPFLRSSIDYLVTDTTRWPLTEPAFFDRYPVPVMTGDHLQTLWEAANWEYPGELASAVGVLDIKTCSNFTGKAWAKGPTSYVVAQLHHYMLVTGLRRAWACVLIGGQEFRVYGVPWDADYATELLAEEERFWDRVVRRDPPTPDPSCSDTTEALDRYLRNGGADPTPVLPAYTVVNSPDPEGGAPRPGVRVPIVGWSS